MHLMPSSCENFVWVCLQFHPLLLSRKLNREKTRSWNHNENGTQTWCPTSHMILSSGLLKTWCRATAKSTTPKLELRCPPIFDIVCTISALNSAASCSRSWQIYVKSLLSDKSNCRLLLNLDKQGDGQFANGSPVSTDSSYEQGNWPCPAMALLVSRLSNWSSTHLFLSLLSSFPLHLCYLLKISPRTAMYAVRIRLYHNYHHQRQ